MVSLSKIISTAGTSTAGTSTAGTPTADTSTAIVVPVDTSDTSTATDTCLTVDLGVVAQCPELFTQMEKNLNAESVDHNLANVRVKIMKFNISVAIEGLYWVWKKEEANPGDVTMALYNEFLPGWKHFQIANFKKLAKQYPGGQYLFLLELLLKDSSIRSIGNLKNFSAIPIAFKQFPNLWEKRFEHFLEFASLSTRQFEKWVALYKKLTRSCSTLLELNQTVANPTNWIEYRPNPQLQDSKADRGGAEVDSNEASASPLSSLEASTSASPLSALET